MKIGADLVRELLDYNHETGVFTWRARPGYSGKRSAWNKKWAGKTAGSRHSDGYVVIRINKKCFYAHRLAWMFVHGDEPDRHIDHINGIAGDNRIANLRLATAAENNRNRGVSARSTSKVKGVSWCKDGQKWGAWTSVNGKSIPLGRFDSIEEARRAYSEAVARLHGDFGRSQ